MTTLVRAWTHARERLAQAGVDSPAIDARLLLEVAADATRADIITDPYREVTFDQQARLDAYVARRASREPVSRILGRRGFWKIMLSVTPDVLSPRPDTETVVQEALTLFAETRRFQLLDLGVGSGAIALAILAERPHATALGVDSSEEALAVARDNAANLGLAARLALLRGDWTAGLGDASFDLVVANPPYVASDVIPTLDPEVREHDPRLALDGGADGLDAYRILAPEVLRVLRAGAPFLVEIGHDQSAAVEALFRAAGAHDVRTLRDLSNKDRVVAGVRAPPDDPGQKALGDSRSSR